jgi:hypothetical protein
MCVGQVVKLVSSNTNADIRHSLLVFSPSFFDVSEEIEILSQCGMFGDRPDLPGYKIMGTGDAKNLVSYSRNCRKLSSI